MDLSGYSVAELIGLYSLTIKEMKQRGILRTKNVVGELGEYLVMDLYNKSSELPILISVPLGTKNINAISLNGDRYSIKSTTGNVTGVFYGLEPEGSNKKDKPIFEYVVICKMDEDYELEGVYQLDWEAFESHKKWHSRMKAWNLSLSKNVIADSVVIYDKKSLVYQKRKPSQETKPVKEKEVAHEEANPVTVWSKTEKVNHTEVANKIAESLGRRFGKKFEKLSGAKSRFISNSNDELLYVLSANYSERNNEYWYSINDENIPWMELYPACHIAFALGSEKKILLFNLAELKELLKGCLRTKEDESKKKKPHYHISFAVENNGRIYFKQKKPKHNFIDVSDHIIQR